MGAVAIYAGVRLTNAVANPLDTLSSQVSDIIEGVTNSDVVNTLTGAESGSSLGESITHWLNPLNFGMVGKWVSNVHNTEGQWYSFV